MNIIEDEKILDFLLWNYPYIGDKQFYPINSNPNSKIYTSLQSKECYPLKAKLNNKINQKFIDTNNKIIVWCCYENNVIKYHIEYL